MSWLDIAVYRVTITWKSGRKRVRTYGSPDRAMQQLAEARKDPEVIDVEVKAVRGEADE